MSIAGFFQPGVTTVPTTTAPSANDAIVNGFTPEPANGQNDIPGDAGNLLERAIDILSYLSIGLAVLAIILVGIYIITNVASNNGGAAAGNLRRVLWVLGGLIVVFNAPQIVSLVV